jgi:hypothetical protein
MMDAIVITTYYDATPPRVFWVVLKGNKVEGSGLELAQKVALQAAYDEAVKQAESCARAAGLAEPFQIEHWRGVYGK